MNFLKGFLNFVFPPICEGCDCFLEEGERRLCRSCLDELEPNSFSVRSSFLLDGQSSVWDYEGAAQRLILRYKQQKKDLESFLFANYLFLQLHQLKWPFPEVLVSVPQDPFKKFWKRFDPIGLIGTELSKLLEIPKFEGLKRLPGRPSQASLIRQERRSLREEEFSLAEQSELRGKKVLLIDDVCTTGATLEAAAACLWKGSPLSIYGLTLARVEAED